MSRRLWRGGAAVVLLAGLAASLATAPAQAAASGTPIATVDVISDVQSDIGNTHLKDKVIPTLNARSWPASALVVNGDAVTNGATANWTGFQDALTANGGHDAKNTILTIGNHEYYGSEGSSTYRKRFLKNAGRDKVWTEQVIGGVPLLVVGSEAYDYSDKNGNGPFVTFSQDQLDWFTGRMKHWAEENKPVLVFSHQVLPDSVSGTDRSFYANDYGDQLDEFKAALKLNSKAILFTSHTHWLLTRSDWTVDYDLGDGAKIPVFNTGAVGNAYGPSGTDGEKKLGDDYASGLRVHIYADTIRVEAWDFWTGKLIKYEDVAV